VVTGIDISLIVGSCHVVRREYMWGPPSTHHDEIASEKAVTGVAGSARFMKMGSFAPVSGTVVYRVEFIINIQRPISQ